VNTPIYDFVQKYCDISPVRLHMPGHKGCDSELGIEHLDITEFDGADNLWDAEGIIKDSEANASRRFGANTFYSTEGSSLCIRAMLFMIKKWALQKGTTPFILAARNAHKTFINAAALLDIEVDWLMPRETDTYESCTIEPSDIQEYLNAATLKPTALYITTPDYLGNMLDVSAIAKVCHDNNILLMVDNAHGAYLKFLEASLHPMDLGADMCCDSAHKTLYALTGAAYLHVSHNTFSFFRDNAKEALEMFASTSPSYLILESLDLTNRFLADSIHKELALTCSLIRNVKTELEHNGYTLKGTEPLKITIDAKAYGYTGNQLADLLNADNIFVEYHDDNYLVAMFSGGNSLDDITRFSRAMGTIPKKEPILSEPVTVSKPVQAIKPSEALYMESEIIPASESVGRILAKTAVSCPPCVPIYVAGEEITKVPDAEYIRVIKNPE